MLGWTTQNFEGFAAEDFAAFETNKQRSNRFNLERMKVTDKLSALGGALAQRRPELAESLRRVVSDPTPSLFNNHEVKAAWLTFHRPTDEQRSLLAAMESICPNSEAVQDPQPLHKEPLLAIRVDEAGLDVGLYLHGHAWVDVQNLVKLDEADRARFAELLEAVPKPIECFVADEERPPADAIDALTDAPASWLRIRWHLNPQEDFLTSPSCVDELAEVLSALLPVRGLIAWSEDNDRLELAEQVARSRAVKTAAEETETDSAKTAPLSMAERLPEWARFTPKPPPPKRPPRRPARPRPERPQPERPQPERPQPGRPQPGRPQPDRPQPDRPRDDRPRDDRPRDDRPRDDRPRGDRPRNDRPHGDRPRGDRPRGDRPRPERSRGERRPPRKDDRPSRRREERRPQKEWKPSDEPVATGCMARVTGGLFKGQMGKVLDLDSKGRARMLIYERKVTIEAKDLQRLEG